MQSIGIDLGTTNSVASQMVNGKPIVIQYQDNVEYETRFPSVVSRNAAGEFLVGFPALRNMKLAPHETIYSAKRLMGLNYDDPKVQEVAKHVSYKVVPADDPQDTGVYVRIGSEKFTPVEISTRILQRVMEVCAQQLGPVRHATITVPAMFQDCQRNATVEAGDRAGLSLRPILDEPIAAALAFGYGQNTSHRLLVYDLGGGTFDVSVLQLKGENLAVLDRSGDMWLGGDDFDQSLIRRMQDWLVNKYGPLNFEDPQLRRILKTHAEKAKIKLSETDSIPVSDPFVTKTPAGDPVSLDLTLTRSDFESDIRPLVDRSLTHVESVMDRNDLKPEHFTAVLLVGGSTLVPYVRERLRAKFGEERVRGDIDPMHCVSLGAALWNERFPVDKKGRLTTDNLKRTSLTTAMHLGVEIYYDGNPHFFEKIIPRGSSYPTEANQFRRTFKPTSHNQKRFRIPIFQGNATMTTFNTCQGIFRYEAPRPVPFHSSILVTFNIDVHGKLTVEVELEGDPSSRQQFEIERNRPLLEEQEESRAASWKDDLGSLLETLRRFQQKYKLYLSKEETENIDSDLRDGEAVLSENRREDWQRIRRRIVQALGGSGLASDLFMAVRAQEMADVQSARTIGLTRTNIERLFRAGKLDEIPALRDKLKLATNTVFKAQDGGGNTGPDPEAITKQ